MARGAGSKGCHRHEDRDGPDRFLPPPFRVFRGFNSGFFICASDRTQINSILCHSISLLNPCPSVSSVSHFRLDRLTSAARSMLNPKLLLVNRPPGDIFRRVSPCPSGGSFWSRSVSVPCREAVFRHFPAAVAGRSDSFGVHEPPHHRAHPAVRSARRNERKTPGHLPGVDQLYLLRRQ